MTRKGHSNGEGQDTPQHEQPIREPKATTNQPNLAASQPESTENSTPTEEIPFNRKLVFQSAADNRPEIHIAPDNTTIRMVPDRREEAIHDAETLFQLMFFKRFLLDQLEQLQEVHERWEQLRNRLDPQEKYQEEIIFHSRMDKLISRLRRKIPQIRAEISQLKDGENLLQVHFRYILELEDIIFEIESRYN